MTSKTGRYYTKLAYRNSEVSEVPFFFPKRFSSYHEYHKADITTGNINDINVTYIIWYLIKQDKLTFYEESCFVTLFTTFTQFLDQTALLLGFFFE